MLYYETIEPQALELLKKLQEIPSLRKTRLVGGTSLAFYLLNNVKIDIVDYAYHWLNEAIRIDGIQLAGLADIAAMKLAAITGRGTKKNFIDLYFLSRRFILSEMQSFYEDRKSVV